MTQVSTQGSARIESAADDTTRFATLTFERSVAAPVSALWEAWNRRAEGPGEERARPGLAQSWAGFLARREAFCAHARAWSDRLAARRDLAAELVDFADNCL